MSLESENNKKLQDFFSKEYKSLKIYVNTRIKNTANQNAEDIIQDVALKLFSGADRYAPISNVGGFVYRSIRNKIIDTIRTNKQAPQVAANYELISLAEILNPTDSYVSKEMIINLKKSIRDLKPVYRDVIIAVDFEGYTYKEISEETGVSEGTLMSRRHRAIGILYKKLKTNI